MERVAFVLERDGDGEAVALREAAHNASATRGRTGGIDESEASPEHRNAGGGGEFGADGNVRTTRAVGRLDHARGRMPECDAVGIDGHAQGQLGDADEGDDFVGVMDEADDGRADFR